MTMPIAVRLWLEGERSIPAIALAAGICDRTVYRQLQAAGLREKRVRPTYRDEQLVIERVSEGMPVTWAIEGTDVPYNRALGLVIHLPNRRQDDDIWKNVWQSIRKDDALVTRHYWFAPPTADVAERRPVAA